MWYMPVSRAKLVDLFVVCALTVLAAVTSVLFRLDVLTSVVLYFAVPAAYLCFREAKNYKKIVTASVVLGILLGMSYDIVAEFNNAYVVNYHNAFLGSHVIAKTPLGDFLWAFLIPFFIFVFYEHFLGDERILALSVRNKKAIGASVALFFGTSIIIMLRPGAQPWRYGYLIVGLISVLPLLALFFARKKLVLKLLILGAFFFAVNLLFEITALTLGQWSFPGHYVGSVTLLGVSLPLEELLLWIAPSAIVFVFCYELFFDDAR